MATSKQKQNKSHDQEDKRRIKRENQTSKVIVSEYYNARDDLYKDVDIIYKAKENGNTRDEMIATAVTISNIENGINTLYDFGFEHIGHGSDEADESGRFYVYFLAWQVFKKNFGWRPDSSSDVNLGSILESMNPHRKEIKNKLTNIVTEGIQSGLGKVAIKKEIAKALISITKDGVVHGDVANMLRIWRTEFNKYYTNGRGDGQEELTGKGVQMVRQWSTILDGHERPDHHDADGQIADEDGMFTVGGYRVREPHTFGVPEQDINCRCIVVEFFDENQNVDRFTDMEDFGNWEEFNN